MPHSVFSLRTSAYNDFLYAPIGEEDNGMVLTALSALARLGVDPWDEAARLSEQSKETATKRLTSIISGLPSGRWPESSVVDIAARLSALLPGEQVPVARQAMTHAKHLPPPATAMFLFVFLVNALVFFAVREHAAQPTADKGAVTSSTTVPPQVPLP
jgi:hypothetical protein